MSAGSKSYKKKLESFKSKRFHMLSKSERGNFPSPRSTAPKEEDSELEIFGERPPRNFRVSREATTRLQKRLQVLSKVPLDLR